MNLSTPPESLLTNKTATLIHYYHWKLKPNYDSNFKKVRKSSIRGDKTIANCPRRWKEQQRLVSETQLMVGSWFIFLVKFLLILDEKHICAKNRRRKSCTMKKENSKRGIVRRIRHKIYSNILLCQLNGICLILIPSMYILLNVSN